MYIVEVNTRNGRICERFGSYEAAQRRIMQIKDDELLGIPFIFRELPDGSQRLVREDGKPLQWHRLPEDADIQVEATPVPLAEPETPQPSHEGTSQSRCE